MLLAIDIGNTAAKFGVFSGEQLLHRSSIPTKHATDLSAGINSAFSELVAKFPELSQVAVSSVVPDANSMVAAASMAALGLDPFIIDASTPTRIGMLYETPETLGPDRYVNAVAAEHLCGAPVIVASFGTATTIDLVNADRQFCGGTISPGLDLLAAALHLGTANLPRVDATLPKSVIGQTTETSIRAGVVFSYLGGIREIIRRLNDLAGNEVAVVATGGNAAFVAQHIDTINHVRDDLTLQGIRLSFQDCEQ